MVAAGQNGLIGGFGFGLSLWEERFMLGDEMGGFEEISP
jgi:hypothetical protein